MLHIQVSLHILYSNLNILSMSLRWGSIRLGMGCFWSSTRWRIVGRYLHNLRIGLIQDQYIYHS